MANLADTLHDLRQMDDFARQDSPVHRVHPLAKVLVTLVFIVAVVSFGRSDLSRLTPFVFYPVFLLVMADIPMWPMIRRMLMVEPLILGLGILNPLFDTQRVMLAGHSVSAGWLTFASLMFKSSLTVLAGLLLLATTGIGGVGKALRMLRVPRIFVMQLMLLYRYITVLAEEVLRMNRAYAMRAPRQRGIHPKAWGSFAGSLLLRTFDRAHRVYDCMAVRGFRGEETGGPIRGMRGGDVTYMLVWSGLILLARWVHLPLLLENMMTGVLKP